MLSIRQRMLLYATVLLEQRGRVRLRDRIQYLRANPNSVTEDDFVQWEDIDRRLLRGLLQEQPEIRGEFEQHMSIDRFAPGSLFQFFRRAFPHCGYGKSFQWNWHHIIMCQELEDFYHGRITRLMINVPPGTYKSTLTGTIFPAWVWAQQPAFGNLYSSYSNEIPIKCTYHLKTLLKSRWYQSRWGDKVQLVREGERELVNAAGGRHLARGVGGGGLGHHPKFIFFDDPQKGMYLGSKKKMGEAVRYYSNTLATRGMLDDARICVIMQRLAINDLCGVLLGENSFDDLSELEDQDLNDASKQLLSVVGKTADDWRHLCFSMRFDPKFQYNHPLDPRTEQGELLWPEVIDIIRLRRTIREMSLDGEPNVDAQLDQNPKLTSTKLFGDISAAAIQIGDLPDLLRTGRAVRSWDRASTQGGGDYTVGVLMVLYQGTYYVLDVIRVQLEGTRRDDLIVKVAHQDKQRFDRYRVGSELSIGPDSKSAFVDLAKRLDAIGVEAVPMPPGGQDKVERARPFAGAYRNGLVKHLAGKKWTLSWEMELSNFPGGQNDDQVDGGAHGYRELRDWETRA